MTRYAWIVGAMFLLPAGAGAQTATPTPTGTRTPLPTPTCDAGTRRALDVNSLANVATIASVAFTSETAITMATWVKYQTVTGQNIGLVPGTNLYLALLGQGQGDYLTCSIPTDAGSTSCIVAMNGANFGAWWHAGCTWDAATDTITVYLNGAAANTCARTGTRLNSSSTTMRFGSRSDAYTGDGLLADSRIYTTALDATAIANIYNGGGGTCGSDVSNLWGGWKWENSGADWSGNGHTATLNGTATYTDGFTCCDFTPTPTGTRTPTPTRTSPPGCCDNATPGLACHTPVAPWPTPSVTPCAAGYVYAGGSQCQPNPTHTP